MRLMTRPRPDLAPDGCPPPAADDEQFQCFPLVPMVICEMAGLLRRFCLRRQCFGGHGNLLGAPTRLRSAQLGSAGAAGTPLPGDPWVIFGLSALAKFQAGPTTPPAPCGWRAFHSRSFPPRSHSA